ncbi:glycosyl hydrolase family 28-related protein [Rhizobium sp. BK251]|uniref:glycosyl hydrolase family 28-related protein n=1 Tax=Rhizobium sp. BK251 TaxID=2512125 RepID=UPI00104E1913|nr:glycosyl hydrolase family 28-related protein [Rhizobium sp. BK251]TCL70658.1 pectate lyase-like protein [Rhizobium sp. BK251]
MVTKVSEAMLDILGDSDLSRAYVIANFHPSVGPDLIETNGYYAQGDSGGAAYRKVGSQPTHPGKLSITLSDGSTVVWYELSTRRVNIRALGAVGDGTADDSVSLQAAVDTAKALGLPIYIPDGNFKVTATTTIVDFSFILEGDGPGKSVIFSSDLNAPIFEIQVNAATIERCRVDNMTMRAAWSNLALTYTSCCAFLVTGNNTTYFQWNSFTNLQMEGFYSWFCVTKVARTTAFGLECNVAWTSFENITIRGYNNPAISGWKFDTGSGTGNAYYNISGGIGGNVNGTPTPGAVFQFSGSGHVVGDIVVDGGHFGGTTGSVIIGIGPNTVYRQRICISNVQADAGIDYYFGASSTGSIGYTNIKLINCNIGGGAKIGGIPPIRNSQIYDQEASEWRAGRLITTNATGAQGFSLFSLTLVANASAVVEFDVVGVSGGISGCAISTKYLIRAGPSSIAEIIQMSGATSPSGSPPITHSVTPSGLAVTFGASFSPSGAGSYIDGQICAKGGPFVIDRL